MSLYKGHITWHLYSSFSLPGGGGVGVFLGGDFGGDGIGGVDGEREGVEGEGSIGSSIFSGKN